MTITELLLANPGVELTLDYNETLGVFFIAAQNSMGTLRSIVRKETADKEPGQFEDAIKRAMEAVQ